MKRVIAVIIFIALLGNGFTYAAKSGKKSMGEGRPDCPRCGPSNAIKGGVIEGKDGRKEQRNVCRKCKRLIFPTKENYDPFLEKSRVERKNGQSNNPNVVKYEGLEGLTEIFDHIKKEGHNFDR